MMIKGKIQWLFIWTTRTDKQKKITDKVFKFRILAASLNINFNQHVNHWEGKLLIKIMQNVCEIYASDKI